MISSSPIPQQVGKYVNFGSLARRSRLAKRNLCLLPCLFVRGAPTCSVLLKGIPPIFSLTFKHVLDSRFLQGFVTDEVVPDEGGGATRFRAFRVPHVTLLPGLQFSLAGIIGAPATFYGVPAIRFAYELYGYM